MRYLPLIPALLAARSIAAPAPQLPDFAKIDAELPELTKTIPLTAKPTTIFFDPTAAIESVAEAAHTGGVVKRDANRVLDNSGCNVCEVQPTISNSYNVDLSTAEAFLADSNIAAAANGAVTPSGFSKIFSNQQASLNGYVYMGYTVLESSPAYDPSVCATKCNDIAGCAAFNIFFERNPTVDACSSSCENPPAFANIKCSFWGGPATLAAAKNTGQWRREFHVVIAGSNAYNRDGLPEVLGYSDIQSLGDAAINAERDCNNVDTYMTYKLFTNTPFDIRLCAAACDAESAYAVAHPPADGKVRKCNFWNTYILNRNGEPQGQYCSLYTEQHANSFATNVGQWRGNDQYTISASYSSFNLTSPGLPVCPSDITYLRQAGGEFCTSFNAYVAPHTSTEVLGSTSTTATVDNFRTVTNTATVTAAPVRRRSEVADAGEVAIETFQVLFPEKNTRYPNATAAVTIHITDDAQLAKRTAVPTPASITGWDAARISEACSAVATGTITDTVTTSVTTITVATVTNTATQTITNTVTIPGVILASPTAIAGDIRGAPFNIDDSFYQVTLPFAIGAFGTYSTNVFVTTNGVISINSGSGAYSNNQLPTTALPDVSFLAYWDDIYIFQGTPQGIYYEITGAVGSRTVTFEIYQAHITNRNEYYHFAMIFYENQPGVALYKYYQSTNSGRSATVGAQNRGAGRFLQYSYNEAKVLSNTFLRIDTNAGTMTTGNL